MFISDDEAARRVNSSKNILSVITPNIPSSDIPLPPQDIPAVEPDEILPPEDECKSAQEVIDISEKTMRKILGLDLGRRRHEPNMPPEVRAATAVCAQLVDTRTAAQVFETSYHHADELKHGYTHQAARYGGEDPDVELENEINKQKKEVRNLAFEKLTKTLGLITDDKLLAVTDALKLSRISRDLSAVVEKVLPKEAQQMGGVHFHVWKPEMKDEQSYEVVTVGNQS